MTDSTQNSRLGSSLAEIQDMNGDSCRELVVGAPLEDDHQGAVYVFYGRGRTIQRRYRQVQGGSKTSEEKNPTSDFPSSVLLRDCRLQLFQLVSDTLAKVFTGS